MANRTQLTTACLALTTATLVASGCIGPPGHQGPPGPQGPPGGGGGQTVLLLTGSASVDEPSLVRYGMFERENQQDFKESTVLHALPRGGTLRNLFVSPATAPENPGAVVEVTVRINQLDTALSVIHTQANGSGVLSDTTTTVAVNAGDRISIRFAETAGVDPIVTAGLAANYNVTLELHSP